MPPVAPLAESTLSIARLVKDIADTLWVLAEDIPPGPRRLLLLDVLNIKEKQMTKIFLQRLVFKSMFSFVRKNRRR